VGGKGGGAQDWYLEIFEDEVESKEIVEGQGELEHVTGVELHHGLVLARVQGVEHETDLRMRGGESAEQACVRVSYAG